MTHSHNTTAFALSFTAFLTAIETKPIIKALPQLFLFCEALLAGHGAADMFLVNIFFCDPNIVHRLFLQCRHVSQLNSGNAAFDGSFVQNRPVQGKRLLIVRTRITLISHCRKLFLTVPAFGDGILSAIASAFGMLVSPDKPLRLSSRWCHVHLLFADLVGILLLPSLVLCRLQLGGHFVGNFYVFIMGVPSVKVLQIGATFYC